MNLKRLGKRGSGIIPLEDSELLMDLAYLLLPYNVQRVNKFSAIKHRLSRVYFMIKKINVADALGDIGDTQC